MTDGPYTRRWRAKGWLPQDGETHEHFHARRAAETVAQQRGAAQRMAPTPPKG